MPNPVEVVKRAAVEAVEAGKPVNILFGTVLSASPLKIQVDQKSIYTSKMLILTRNVTDFEVDMTVNHSTEDKGGGSGAAAYEAHKHAYYKAGNSRVAYNHSAVSTAVWWWLRSPYYSSHNIFQFVYTDGHDYISTAYYCAGVRPGFAAYSPAG